MNRWAAVLGLWLAGCTSVKLVQRDHCWVRRTERWPGRITEELGPCAAPNPPWSDDRVTRAMQECVARTDHRWQTQTQLAWARREPLPAASAEALQACLDVPAKSLVGDNDLLKRKNQELQDRLTELGHDREALRSRADEERARHEASVGERVAAQERITDRLLTAQEKVGDRLFDGQDALATYLGEAAKKSSQPAVATANATSRSDSDGSAATESAATAPAVAAPPPAASAPAAAKKSAATRASRRAPACPTPLDAAAARRAGPALTACEPSAPAAPAGAPVEPSAAPQAEVAAAPSAAAAPAATPELPSAATSTPTSTSTGTGTGAGAAER